MSSYPHEYRGTRVTFVIIFSVLFVIAIYGVWRYVKANEAQEKYGPLMPSHKRLSWNGPKAIVPFVAKPLAKAASAGAGTRSEPDFTVTVGPMERGKDVIADFFKEPGTWAAAADGAIAGGFLAHAALNIDPHVLDAIEFSTADHLHSLASIDNYVHDHFFAAPIQSADGWFERLTGYVAEQKAAAALEQMGHHVEFAPIANQPVWDLLVDGHPVQIKEGLAGVKDFLAHHPGIDVFAPEEVAAALKDPAVHGLEVLNKDAVGAAAHNAFDNVHGVISPEFHFPFVTLAFSSWREAKLLWKEKTTFERAFKNVGLDVVGVGGGAWAGAKGGALAGAAIGGPVGAAIGGFIGAVAGGIGGKMLSTTIRYADFNKAKDAYNTAVANAQSAVNSQIESSKLRVKELQTEYQQKYLVARNDIERDARRQIEAVSGKFDNDLLSFCERFPHFLEDLLMQLRREEQEVLAVIPSSGPFGVLFPSDGDLYRGVVRAWFKRARKLVKNEIRAFAAIEHRSVENLHTEVQRFLREYTFELKSMADDLGRVATHYQAAQTEAARVRDEAVKKAEGTRATLIEQFGKQVTAMQEKVVEEINRWNSVISDKRDVLKKEAAAVGADI